MALSVATAVAQDKPYMVAFWNFENLFDINPDTALDMTCTKFRRRFTYLEEHTIRQGRDLKDMTLAQMDEIWDEAKRLEREGKL